MAKFEDPGIKEFIRELEFSEKLEDNFFQVWKIFLLF